MHSYQMLNTSARYRGQCRNVRKVRDLYNSVYLKLPICVATLLEN